MKNGCIASLCIVLLFFAVGRCDRHRKEATRLKDNFDAALSEVRRYKTKDSLNAVSVSVLTLTVKEFERNFTELSERAAALELSNRRLLSASRTATVTEYRIETRWRDSIIFVAGRIDTIRCISYNDEFLTFAFCDSSDVAKPFIASRDEMFQYVHRVPRFEWWFIRIGTKGIRQDITFRNPNTLIEYSEYVRVNR